MSKKNQWRISIGPRWTSFTYEREGMEMLGTIQRGMQIGALVRLPDGSYAQVNGDVVEPLGKNRVEFALLAANGRRSGAPIAHVPRQSQSPSPASPPSPSSVVV